MITQGSSIFTYGRENRELSVKTTLVRVSFQKGVMLNKLQFNTGGKEIVIQSVISFLSFV